MPIRNLQWTTRPSSRSRRAGVDATLDCGHRRRPTLASLFLLFSATWLPGCAGARQTTFRSAEQAVEALVVAIRTDDREQIENILGPEADAVLSSGDPVADQNAIADFLQAFDEKHRLVPADAGVMTLQVGISDWPLPIPIIRNGELWHFDTASGLDEILARRIGRNELAAILVCRALVDAQHEYAARDPDEDGVHEYARKAIGDPGQKNGLFWETGPGEPQSPLGLLAALAAAQGYSTQPSPEAPRPFHGYLFRMLMSQGPDAKGGAYDYLVHGRMIGGFAFIAYPAEQGNSGIVTFIVNHEGVVYENYLGPDTGTIARSMTAFDPGPGWKRID